MAIYALIGQSASGKSTVERNLVDLGYPRIISYTTRPMRDNEANGIDYHFVDLLAFKKLAKEGFFSEIAKYRDWFYGLSLNDADYKFMDYIVVVTLHGYEELLKVVDKEDIIAIHIKVEERERIIRQLERGDEVDEVIRRIHTDRVDFIGIEEACDYVVANNNINETIAEVDCIITLTNAK